MGQVEEISSFERIEPDSIVTKINKDNYQSLSFPARSHKKESLEDVDKLSLELAKQSRASSELSVIDAIVPSDSATLPFKTAKINKIMALEEALSQTLRDQKFDLSHSLVLEDEATTRTLSVKTTGSLDPDSRELFLEFEKAFKLSLIHI